MLAHENLKDKARHSLASPKISETPKQRSTDKKGKATQFPLASSMISGASMYPAEKFTKGKERKERGVATEMNQEVKDRSLRRTSRHN